MRAALSLLLVLLPSLADAGVYAGNPKLTVKAFHTVEDLDGGLASVDKVIFWTCAGGSWTNDTNKTFDPAVGATWAFPAGNWCAADVVWYGDVVLEGSNAWGDFEIVSTDAVTRIDLDPSPGNAPLLPFSVEEGTVPTGHPRLQGSVAN